jgi:uracil phosphoribosyltransferase
MVFNLSDQNSIASQFLFEMRDTTIQKDRTRFRKNVERIGQILAYEISKSLAYKEVSVQTPLKTSSVSVPLQNPVLVTILRAGLPLLQGFLDIFDHSDSGFIGAYREEGGEQIKIKLDYKATPSVQGRPLILIDPMLATGNSAVRALETLTENESPHSIHVAAVIAAPEGVDHIRQFAARSDVPLRVWVGAVDEGLNEDFYIVPGLGDAGDLCFGMK